MLQDGQIARRTSAGLELREGGLRVRWEMRDLIASDGHQIQVRFSCVVKALADRVEQQMLEETFLASTGTATADDIAKYFLDGLRQAAEKFVATKKTEGEAGVMEGKKELLTLLMETGKAIAFGCGVALMAPTGLELDCPTLRRDQQEALARETAKRRAAKQVDELRQAAELYAQFQAIRASSPQLSAGQVLGRVAPADQAEMLKSLLAASVTKRSVVWSVAGSTLMRIDLAEESPAGKALAVPPALGPMRSLRDAGDGTLLIGCRGGVMRIDPEQPDQATAWTDTRADGALGFNAAIIMNGRIWATHAQIGLVAWNAAESVQIKIPPPPPPPMPARPGKSPDPEPPAPISPPAATIWHGKLPRNLTKLDDNRLIFSAGSQLVLVSSDGETRIIPGDASTETIGIIAANQRILTIYEDGMIAEFAHDDLRPIDRRRRAGRLTAAGLLPWLGEARLLLAEEEGPIRCLGLDDELVTQYTSVYPSFRILAAANDAVAGVTPDRQRLVVWNSWESRKPLAELYLYGLAKHRIADIVVI